VWAAYGVQKCQRSSLGTGEPAVASGNSLRSVTWQAPLGGPRCRAARSTTDELERQLNDQVHMRPHLGGCGLHSMEEELHRQAGVAQAAVAEKNEHTRGDERQVWGGHG